MFPTVLQREDCPVARRGKPRAPFEGPVDPRDRTGQIEGGDPAGRLGFLALESAEFENTAYQSRSPRLTVVCNSCLRASVNYPTGRDEN